jgi:excisionase family DNA binding protein
MDKEPEKRRQMTKLLTVAEAAEALALKPSTIRAWIFHRKLPCVRCGRAVRVPAAAVAEFIANNTTPALEVKNGRA